MDLYFIDLSVCIIAGCNSKQSVRGWDFHRQTYSSCTHTKLACTVRPVASTPFFRASVTDVEEAQHVIHIFTWDCCGGNEVPHTVKVLQRRSGEKPGLRKDVSRFESKKGAPINYAIEVFLRKRYYKIQMFLKRCFGRALIWVAIAYGLPVWMFQVVTAGNSNMISWCAGRNALEWVL